MKSPVLVAFMVAATAYAGPRGLSQHPRDGYLCELDFAPTSTRLPADMEDKLGEVAAWAKENPDGLIVVGGHGDQSDGGKVVQLSLRRAQIVRDKLVTAGVSPDKLVVAAYGTNGPAPGRRVTLWATHQDLGAVTAQLEHTGARVMRGMPVTVLAGR